MIFSKLSTPFQWLWAKIIEDEPIPGGEPPVSSRNTIKYMDVAEFRRLGLLQEINRRILHPLGLALEVIVEEDGKETLGRIWDYRDDPEGICYDDSIDLLPKAIMVKDEEIKRAKAREEILGYVIQPITNRGE